MNPFIRKVKSQEEKDALIAEARREWDKLGADSHLVAASEEDYLQSISNSIEVEKVPFVEPRPLTTAERTQQDGGLMLLRIMGDRSGDRYDCLSGSLREVAKAND